MQGRLSIMRRVLFLLLLLCATVCAQSPSLEIFHSHAQAAHHCCGLCHSGPAPVLQAAPATLFAPDLPILWLAPAVETVAEHEALVPFCASRAPPR
jgi:hypothetical protein